MPAPFVMHTVDIHEAKAHLSRLIDEAVNGQPFLISLDGKPVVKVSRVDRASVVRLLGFMSGQIRVPDDFDRMGSEQIEH